MRRAAFRLWLRLRYLLWQRRRHRRLSLERCGGVPLVVLPGVFSPSDFRTTVPMVELLEQGLVPEESKVLDLGSGSGVLAVVAACRARRVVAVDIDPAAVRCTRINALLNGVEERVEARQGDLFAAVSGERFDLVLSNPPFLLGEPRDGLDRALRSPDFAERLATGLPPHLAEDGFALVVLSSAGDEDAFLRTLEASGLTACAVLERDLITETVRVYRIESRSP